MEKMFTKGDILKLVVAERTRCVYRVFEEIQGLKNLSKSKPALKARIKVTIDALDELLLHISNIKPVKGEEFEKLIYAACEKDYFGDVMPMNKVTLDATVFPSEEKTIQVVYDEFYGGAHCYIMRESLGYSKISGQPVYIDDAQVIRFVQKAEDRTTIPGIQSEQLVLALLDRTQKLNARFPSTQNEKMMAGLQMFLDACRERVEDRINRGVMGDLKK